MKNDKIGQVLIPLAEVVNSPGNIIEALIKS